MNPVILIILKLLSRPVVCANFQGLEANTFYLLAESVKDTVCSNKLQSVCTHSRIRGYRCDTHVAETVPGLNLVLEYNVYCVFG